MSSPATRLLPVCAARQCPACEAPDTRAFFHLPQAPIFCNVLHQTAAAARQAPVAEVTLRHCAGCGMIYNADFEPERVRYADGYENSLYNSPRFREYAHVIVTELAERHLFAGRLIVEIGCGDGRFLTALCEKTGARGIGFDPSAPSAPAPDRRVELRRRLFEPGCLSEPFHLVVSRHVLEHIHRPLPFLQALHAAARPHNTAIFIEVPNALWMLRGGGVWDIIYEHCSYLTPRALATLLSRAGFSVTDLRARYGCQFLTIEAVPGGRAHEHVAASQAPPALDRNAEEERTLIEAFARRFEERRQHWAAAFAPSSAHRTVIWGAGSKGVAFLCTVDPNAEHIAAAVDLNPRKHGRFTPVTGHRVVPPSALRELNPTRIIVMNPIYLDEIQRTAADLNLRAEIIPV